MANEHKPEFAPDGVHRSNVRMTVARFPLITVARKDAPGYTCKITEADFDPAVYVRVTEEAPKRVKLEPPALSAHTEAELLLFTMAKLRKLPEYELIDSPASKKEDLVAQILEAREDASE